MNMNEHSASRRVQELETSITTLQARVAVLEEQAGQREEQLRPWMHDLRTPLTYLVGYSELLLQRDLSAEAVKQMATQIASRGHTIGYTDHRITR